MGNAELRVTLVRIENKVDEGVKQGTATNGHVARALVDIENLKRWRTGMAYAWIVFSLAILPILGFTLYKVWGQTQITTSQIKSATETGVLEALSATNSK